MVNEENALELVRARLNRLGVSLLDDYLRTRITAAVQRLTRLGITLTDSADDLMLVVDYTVWEYQNRDKGEAMPQWLRLVRRERWLKTDGGGSA